LQYQYSIFKIDFKIAIAIDFDIDIENVRNTRHRNHWRTVQRRITEIAIYKFDGHEIVDQFISLVNPEIPIQPFVVKLTGINNTMLQGAPKFFEVAKRIIEMTNDCTLLWLITLLLITESYEQSSDD
jgi:hypothetical protein